VGQILNERELEFKEMKKKKPQCTEVGFHPHSIGSVVQSPIWLPSFCSGLGAFPQFPKEETLLNKTERENRST
jgi:hypothetical protein